MSERKQKVTTKLLHTMKHLLSLLLLLPCFWSCKNKNISITKEEIKYTPGWEGVTTDSNLVYGYSVSGIGIYAETPSWTFDSITHKFKAPKQ